MEKIIPFFKKHSLKFPSKNLDFIIFCEMMNLIEKGDHLKNLGLKKLFQLKQRMH
jgi:hypothetical protein